MTSHTRNSTKIALAAAALLMGCGRFNLSSPEESSGAMGVYAVRGNAVRKLIWKTKNIRVCWKSFAESTPLGRNIVKRRIQETWNAVSGINFYGWEECRRRLNPRDQDLVHIKVADDGRPVSSAMGRELMVRGNVMTLNFTYRHPNFAPRGCRRSQAALKHCIETDAIHEFGHAMGLVHEHLHTSTPQSCRNWPREYANKLKNKGYLAQTRYDAYSIMSYCKLPNGQNPSYSNKLSAGDISTAQRLYGKP